MNWILKIKRFGDSIKNKVLKKFPSKIQIEKSDWVSCCVGPIRRKDLEANQYTCKECGRHHRMSCVQRFETFFGKDNYEIIKTPQLIDEDPLKFEDTKPYKERLDDAKKKTGQDCAIMVATGKVNGIDIVAAASNFMFMGGSVSISESEAIVHAIQYAIKNKKSFINFCSGGGMRMHTSSIALHSGMVKTTLAINELKKAKLPYIVVFADPCAGGITASYGMLGDVHFSEPGALVAFAGRRVVQSTVKENLPESFQRSSFLLDKGFIDREVNRKDLNYEIGKLLSILLKKNTETNLDHKDETSEDSQSFSKAI